MRHTTNPQESAEPTMKPQISCFHAAAILRWLDELGVKPEQALGGIAGNPNYLVLDRASHVVPVSAGYLLDRRNWISNELSLHIFRNTAAIIGGNRPMFLAGHKVFDARMNGAMGWALRLIALKPEKLAGKIEAQTAKLNRTKTAWIPRFGPNGMILRLAFTDDSVEKSPLACDYNEGGMVGFASLWGQEVRSTKTACACAGDPYCEYEVTWTKRSAFQTLFRAASLSYQLLQDELEDLS
jgi:hypothetical protein